MEASPPTRWSELKGNRFLHSGKCDFVSTYAVEWIERYVYFSFPSTSVSPPTRWSELKESKLHTIHMYSLSPPTRWSELKVLFSRYNIWCFVSTYAVEWIERPVLQRHWILIRSPPTRWSGLKLVMYASNKQSIVSPPTQWSGLKGLGIYCHKSGSHVPTSGSLSGIWIWSSCREKKRKM